MKMKQHITKQYFTNAKKRLFQQTLISISSILFVIPAFAAGLIVDKWTLINKLRIDRTHYEYTYFVNVTNTTPLLATATTAVVTSSVPSTTIVDGGLSFGDIPGNSTKTSVDLFSFRQDRRVPFDPTVLSFDLLPVLAVDTTPPTVISVSPADGSVGVNTKQVALTFSEELSSGVLVAQAPFHLNATLFVNGVRAPFGRLSPPYFVSSIDPFTVVLTPSYLPSDSLIQVAVNGTIEDLSGNAIGAPFLSEFRTTAVSALDSSVPFVVSQRPKNGSINIPLDSSVIMFINESLDVASVPTALTVLQNGAAINGSVQVTNSGRAVEFTPSTLWIPGALVEITLNSTALDVSGNPLVLHQSSFGTVTDPLLSRPTVVSDSLATMSGSVAQNSVLEVAFSEALDATTVGTSTIVLRENVVGGSIVPLTVSLRGDRIVRLLPDTLLMANTDYVLDVLNGIQDLQGQTPDASTNPAISIFHRIFTTSNQSNLIAPSVSGVSPPDGAADVPLNTQIRVRFNKPINPLSINEMSLVLSDGVNLAVASSFIISNSDQDVLIVPHTQLTQNQQYSLTISGVEDSAGNMVSTWTSNIITTALLATDRPFVTSRSPLAFSVKKIGAGGLEQVTFLPVPINSRVILRMNRRMDPLTVDISTLIVRDDVTLQNQPGSLSVTTDGREIHFLPKVPFEMGRSYSVVVSPGVEDLAGNTMLAPRSDLSFTTMTSAEDISPPMPRRFLGVSSPALTNVRIELSFNEPIQNMHISGVSLLGPNGVPAPVTKKLYDSSLLTLRPSVLLDPLTRYTLIVGGIEDLAGNVMPDLTLSFTTGSVFDITRDIEDLFK